jgi:hypothetical protein
VQHADPLRIAEQSTIENEQNQSASGSREVLMNDSSQIFA